MITFHIFTILPKSMDSYLNESILARAQKKRHIKIKIHDIRKFAKNKHKTTDDRPFGGGPGMILKIEPLISAISSILSKIKNKKSKIKIILLATSGKQFTQKTAIDFAKKYENILLICGRYEGIDERVKRVIQDMGFKIQELSTGPYILTGGELPAMAVVDAVSRHVSGVLGKEESLEEKKGSYPVYTRPEVFSTKSGKKYRVPKVLLSGDHKKINEWRKKHSKIIYDS